MEDHAVMRSHYCPAAVLELLHTLHHPARETLHESIPPQLHFTPNKPSFATTRVCMNQIPPPLSACWVFKKVQSGWVKIQDSEEECWIIVTWFSCEISVDCFWLVCWRANFDQNTVRSPPIAVVPPQPSDSGKWDLKSLRQQLLRRFCFGFSLFEKLFP